MIGVVQALERCNGLHARGYTFLNGKGPGEDLVLSFHELRREAMRRAAALEAQGLRKGDRLAMVLPDGPDFVPTFLGALWAGIVPVPLYPPLSLGKLDAFMEALITILNAAQPKAIVTDDRVAKILWSAIGKVPSIEKVIEAKALASAPFVERPHAPIADADIAFLQFTSGSTSTPKGVVVTHGSLAANCNAIVHDGLRAQRDRDIGVSWLPLYHDMGLIGFVLTPLIEQISIVYIPTLSFIKNATLWMETLSKYKATMTFAPNFAYALVTKRARPEQVARWDLSQMRVFGCGAEPINPETMRAFLKAMEPAGLKPQALLPCYGMAEATLAMAFVGMDDPLKTDRIDAQAYHAEKRARPAASGELLETVCCGRTFPGHALSIQDESGALLPERAVGEICFQGPSVAAGYFNRPDATAESFRDGWLRTGDLGYLADGELYISGRLKDILIVNGRNYYPQRIEWLVDEIPGVRKGSAVVFTRPGKSSEEIIVAAETRAPEGLADQIKARISEEFQLSVSEVALVAPGSLPKTSSGKLQRRKTREQFLNGTLGREGVRSQGFNGSRMLVAKHLALSIVGRARHSARGLLKRFKKAV
jgi:fatty-acyl-CoA synthase